MRWCWRHNSNQRPTFCEIIEELVPDLNPGFREVSYFFSNANTEHAHTDSFIGGGDPDDCRTPLTGSPRNKPHLRPDLSDGGSDVDPLNMDDMTFSMGDDSSSSLSYESHNSLEISKSCHHKHACDCVDVIEPKAKIKPHHQSPIALRRLSETSSMMGSAINHSNEGSKESSKSSNSGPVNGMANGHLPISIHS